MAMASAKPRPISSGTRIGPITSGFRPIASMALPTPYPTPMPGPTAPRPIDRAGAHTFGAWVAPAWAKKPSSENTRENLRRDLDGLAVGGGRHLALQRFVNVVVFV